MLSTCEFAFESPAVEKISLILLLCRYMGTDSLNTGGWFSGTNYKQRLLGE